MFMLIAAYTAPDTPSAIVVCHMLFVIVYRFIPACAPCHDIDVILHLRWLIILPLMCVRVCV